MTQNSPSCCFSCGSTAKTREHVFPKWLQNNFNLWDQKLKLPNGSSIPYRQLIVPLCSKCNSEIYGPIENRISMGTETERDIWLWCNKIHYGMITKYQDLKLDRSMGGDGPKISDFVNGKHVFNWDKRFLGVARGVFKTHPDPFGSVFRFDFGNEQEYTFAHVLFCLGICVSFGSRGYVVFLTDGQTTMNQTSLRNLRENLVAERIRQAQAALENGMSRDRLDPSILESTLTINDILWFFANCLEFLARMTLSIPIVQTPSNLTKLERSNLRKETPINKERFSIFCKLLGLDWIDSDEMKNRD